MTLLSALLETSVYAAILYLAVTLFKRILQKKLSSALHFALWLLVVARLCVPVTLESGFHFIVIEREAAQSGAVQDIFAVHNEGFVPYNAPVARPDAAMPVSDAETPPRTTDGTAAAALKTPLLALTWTDALLALWALGVLVRLAALLFHGVRLTRAVKENGFLPDARLMRIYRDCARRLALRRVPKLRLLSGVSSPALTVGFKPAVLLPARLAEEFSDERLSFAILHELTHYKRGDHVLSLLMRFLEAAYWFSPFVWLTGRGMGRDMETACDADVTARLGGEGRREYALTLLTLFSRERREAYVLGMALSAAESDAKRRIDGVFRARKSKWGARLSAFMLALVLLVSCFTTACRPTPEGDVVVNKGDGRLENAISGTPAPALTLPTSGEWHVVRKSDSGRVYIIVDADIVVPDAEAFPVYNIDHTAGFSEEFVATVHRELLNGAPLVNAQRKKSRGELEEEYMEASRRLAELKEKGVEALGEYVGENTPEQQLAEELGRYEAQLESLILRMETAPEAVEDEYVEPNPNAENEWGRGFCTIPQYALEYGVRHFNVFNGGDESRPYSKYVLYVQLGGQYGETSASPLRSNKISMTPEEARSAALRVLERVGFGEDVRVGSCVAAALTEASASDGRAENNYAYVVNFERVIGGVPVFANVSRWAADRLNPDRDATMYYSLDQTIMVSINDTGLHELHIYAPYKILGKLNENVQLLPVEEIKERILQQLLLENACWEDAEGTVKAMVEVARVELGYGRAMQKNSFSEQMLVPVWNVYCYNTKDGERSVSPHPVLTLNAIDGSRM